MARPSAGPFTAAVRVVYGANMARPAPSRSLQDFVSVSKPLSRHTRARGLRPEKRSARKHSLSLEQVFARRSAWRFVYMRFFIQFALASVGGTRMAPLDSQKATTGGCQLLLIRN